MFRAKFRGVCPECDGEIRVNDLCFWNENVKVAHVLCPEERDVLKAAPTGVCPKCFIERSLDGSCFCEE